MTSSELKTIGNFADKKIVKSSNGKYAGPYARERHDGHLAALDAALAAGGDDAVRNLAPNISPRAAARSVESRHANPS